MLKLKYGMGKLISVFSSALLLLLFMTIIPISNNSPLFGQSESMSEEMADDEAGGEGGAGGIGKHISSITEWTGIFSLGIITGLLASKTNPPSSNNSLGFGRRRSIIISIATLSLSVGAIHLLLVPEHSKESLVWGLVFLVSGIAQMVFGIIILFAKKPIFKTMLCLIGIIGNAMLVITFILVRLVTPPFSPEGAPINELEPNGIITLIIEIVLVILLSYELRFREVSAKLMAK